MGRIFRSVIIGAFFCGLSFISPSSLDLVNTGVYASEKQPFLRNITLSDGPKFKFDQDVHSYIVDVDKDIDVISVKIKPDEAENTVKIDGEIVTKDDSYKKWINLKKGKNKVEIEVEDAKTEAVSKYTVFVYRGGKDAVYLKDIRVDDETIGFDNSINFYNLELDEGTEMVELNAVTEDENYTVTVNKTELKASNITRLRLHEMGKYTLTITVTDKETGRVGTYTLNIYLGIPVTPDVQGAINAVLKPNQWLIVNGRWRYNDSKGDPLKSTWFYDNKYKRYFHFSGAGNMQTGWIKDNGKSYYLNKFGMMETGWVLFEDKWYYLGADGAMRTGWLQDEGKWYFLNEDGSMETGWIIKNGKWYCLNNDGAMETGWIPYKYKWYYLNSSGEMEIGWTKIDGEWYYFNYDGSMKSGEWFKYTGDWYYLNFVGNMRHRIESIANSGWLAQNGKYYYFNEDGTMNNQTKTIDGYTYDFNQDGSVKFD
ncbi:cadherin-like beta sandwich domain-containing protein [Clostridium saccharoperbutylacetonicum]|uniref:cadherin-like beta sandwich domain-containing protein n=1 Tax=Clostridium saccharoperbutylacetonicum TaxID=36745 RepID=UPI000983A874|nr:cadherin-like beta sandwich domain-containing protein [Clostridium saccharoperbutylacetonicum]AQR97812.1 putative endo-beta-N-acetylglucosaminidase precursor [Clostridium saccharoperbutylacetonicum]